MSISCRPFPRTLLVLIDKNEHDIITILMEGENDIQLSVKIEIDRPKFKVEYGARPVVVEIVVEWFGSERCTDERSSPTIRIGRES